MDPSGLSVTIPSTGGPDSKGRCSAPILRLPKYRAPRPRAGFPPGGATPTSTPHQAYPAVRSGRSLSAGHGPSPRHVPTPSTSAARPKFRETLRDKSPVPIRHGSPDGDACPSPPVGWDLKPIMRSRRVAEDPMADHARGIARDRAIRGEVDVHDVRSAVLAVQNQPHSSARRWPRVVGLGIPHWTFRA